MRPFVILIFLALFLRDSAVRAQTFTDVSAGSIYACGFFGDGSSKIFFKNNGNYEVVTFQQASKAIIKDRNRLRNRVQFLKEAKADLRGDLTLSAKEISQIVGFFKDFNTDNNSQEKFPKTKRERIEAIDLLVSYLNTKIKNRNTELQGLKNCNENVRPDPGTLEVKVVTISNSLDQRIAVRILLLIPAKVGKTVFGERQYCTRPKDDTPGTSIGQTFRGNPCQTDPILLGINCSSVVPDKKLGAFHGGASFGGVPTDDQINQAIDELTVTANKGFSGDAPRNGSCSHF